MMKHLTDSDIVNMIGDGFTPDERSTRNAVRKELALSKKIQKTDIVPKHITLDFHQHTEEQAWSMIISAAQSGARTATVITGASGILKVKFQQWVRDSILSPYIIECVPINNGSFSVRFKNKK